MIADKLKEFIMDSKQAQRPNENQLLFIICLISDNLCTKKQQIVFSLAKSSPRANY